MSKWTVTLTNNTTGAVEINDLGLSLAGSETRIISHTFKFDVISTSQDLKALIDVGTIAVNDGTDDLTPAEGVNYIFLENKYHVSEEYITVGAGHTLLGGRSELFQHPITSITNLTEELSAKASLDDLAIHVDDYHALSAIHTADVVALSAEIDTVSLDLSGHMADVANPHSVTQTQVGLSNVENYSAANLPLSNATQVALALKSDITYTDSENALLSGAIDAVTGNDVLEYWTESESTTGVNVTVPVVSWTPVTAGTNTNISLIPKGTGGILVTIPDGGIVGGNVRGEYSIDLQMNRTISTMVASGNYSTIGGGYRNTASGIGSTVGGGDLNQSIGDYSTVGGGQKNTASGNRSFVGGGGNDIVGQQNNAGGNWSVVVGGFDNDAYGNQSFVGGGNDQSLDSLSINGFIGGGSYHDMLGGSHSVIAGGSSNTVNNAYSFIGGGTNNITANSYASVIGGDTNTVSGQYSFIGGGDTNNITSSSSFIGCGVNNIIDSVSTGGHVLVGGLQNSISSAGGGNIFIGGGFDNNITESNKAVIVGGWSNNISNAQYAVIVGGYYNINNGFASFLGAGGWNGVDDGNEITIDGFASVLVGGRKNTTAGQYSFLGGGYENSISTIADYGVIAGGRLNVSSGIYSTIAGGYTNVASGSNSTVAGGYQNSVAGSDGSVGGGRWNIIDATSTYSVIAGGGGVNSGQGNEIHSSPYGTITGGNDNILSGSNYCSIGGGRNNLTQTNYSCIPGGYGAVTRTSGQMAFAGGRLSVDGDTQSSVYVPRRNVISSAKTYLATVITLDPNQTMSFIGTVTARTSGDTPDIASWKVEGVVTANSAGAVTVHDYTVTVIYNPTSWTIDVYSPVANSWSIGFTATGWTENIKVVAKIDTSEVIFA